MTSVTAHDYAWIRSSQFFRYALEAGYTLTLVRGVAPGEVLRVTGAEPRGTCTGVDALIEQQEELFEATDYSYESFIAGAFTVPGAGGDWALVLHFDGGAVMQPRFLEALSAGGRAVVHSSNGGKPIHLFHWYEDGKLRTSFEGPTARNGSTPDALNSVMREVGFHLSDDEADTGVYVEKASVLALAERLTGVRVTEELLHGAEYQLGHVLDEPAEEWTGIVIDITDAHGERFYKEVTREEVEAAVACARAAAAEPIVIRRPSPPAP